MNLLEGKLWTIDDVADFIQVKVSVVQYWLYHAELPHIKLGKQIRFDPSDIMNWLKSHKSDAYNKSTKLKLIK